MSLTDELIDWTNAQKCQKAVEALKKNGFDAIFCQSGEEVYHYIVNEAQEANSVGFGGSLSITDLKLGEKLKEMGKEILNHNLPGVTPEQKVEINRRQLTSDLFLTGSNAVTLSGKLVNIDGNGNRVASMFFGPKKLIIVVGRNKLVDGGYEEAVARIKQFAAPPNAKRLGLPTPCAATGFCADCDSAYRICRITTVIDKKPRNTDIRVLVVNEDMGL